MGHPEEVRTGWPAQGRERRNHQGHQGQVRPLVARLLVDLQEEDRSRRGSPLAEGRSRPLRVAHPAVVVLP